jgi:hypothetical protein
LFLFHVSEKSKKILSVTYSTSSSFAFLLTTPITYWAKRREKKKLLGDSENYLREV